MTNEDMNKLVQQLQSRKENLENQLHNFLQHAEQRGGRDLDDPEIQDSGYLKAIFAAVQRNHLQNQENYVRISQGILAIGQRLERVEKALNQP